MLKWIFVALGLFFLWGGIDNQINYSETVNEDPEMVTPERLKEIIAGDKQHFVRFAGSPDTNRRLYSTYLHYPAYSRYAPWEVLSAADFSRGLESLVGAQVEFSLPISGTYIEMESMQINEDNEKTASSIRLMAPLAGTNAMVWAFSPPFNFNEQAQNEWLGQQKFTGRLSKMRDLNRNYTLRHELSEISRTYAESGAFHISYDALLLDTWVSSTSDKQKAKTEYLMAVQDTDASVFIKTNQSGEADIFAKHMIGGVVEPQESRFYSGLAEAMGGASLPAKIGIITSQSGKDINEENFYYTKVGVIGGIIFLALAALMFRASGRRR